MPTKDLTIAIVGSGGDGVVTMGEMLAQAAARDGLNVIKTEAYGPQIRGGESSCTVRISAEQLYAQKDRVDILILFNWADFGRFRSEIVPAADAAIIYEAADAGKPPDDALAQLFGTPTEGLKLLPVPLIQLAKDEAGTPAAKNLITLGVLSALFGLPGASIRSAVERKFAKKKATVLESNLKGFDGGVVYARQNAEQWFADGNLENKRLEYVVGEPKILMSGNEASAVAAIHAGCRFFAGYPITPSSEILHLLGEWLPKVGGAILQTEDELAAISAVVGASFAGVKAMTATSGPGLALMTETVGLASIAEVPTVIVNVQRGGPSTGIPTKSEQSDLWHALFSGHGDMPRVVLGAADVEDCFHATVEAFNIAEEFQIPVVLLTDQAIGQRRETLCAANLHHPVVDRARPTEDELKDYKRYRDTANGVSPMSIPGMKGGIYQTNGLEHDESGRPNSGFLMHERMNAKRFRKLWDIRAQHRFVRRFGPETADVGVLCWGSSKGPVEEAVVNAERRGQKVSAFVPRALFPFPKYELEQFMKSVGQLIIVELNYTAQFYKYLRTFIDFPPGKVRVFKRSGGKALTVAEVEEQIQRALEPTKELEVLV